MRNSTTGRTCPLEEFSEILEYEFDRSHSAASGPAEMQALVRGAFLTSWEQELMMDLGGLVFFEASLISTTRPAF